MSDAIPAAESLLSYTGIFYAVVQVVILRPTTTATTAQKPLLKPTTVSKPQAQEPIPTTIVSTRYFVPIEERMADTPSVLAMKTPFHCRGWRQINQEQADVTVRKSEMDIAIGDGETWTEMKGHDKVWCEKCEVGCALRGWVRED
jgi:hypothetical protein